MTVFLVFIVAASIVLDVILALLLVHRAKAITQDIAANAREVGNLAFAIKAQNDAMLAARGIGGGGGRDAGRMVPMDSGEFIREPVWPSNTTTMNGSNSGHKAVTEGYLGDNELPKVSAGNWYC